MESWLTYKDPYVQELERQERNPFKGAAVSRAMIEVKGDTSGATVYAFKEGWYKNTFNIYDGDVSHRIIDADREAADLVKWADIVVE